MNNFIALSALLVDKEKSLKIYFAKHFYALPQLLTIECVMKMKMTNKNTSADERESSFNSVVDVFSCSTRVMVCGRISVFDCDDISLADNELSSFVISILKFSHWRLCEMFKCSRSSSAQKVNSLPKLEEDFSWNWLNDSRESWKIQYLLLFFFSPSFDCFG